MALDKLVDSTQLDADLTTVANAIRTKGGTSEQLSFPSGMADAIAAIPSGGITPTGNINITDTNVTDVTQYATAQVVDADLVAGNIKKDVNILGIVGSFEGGGLPTSISKIDGGSFTLASNVACYNYYISHNLGTVPKGFMIWNEDVEQYTAGTARTMKNILAVRRTVKKLDGTVSSLGTDYFSMWNADGNPYLAQSFNYTTQVQIDREYADDTIRYYYDSAAYGAGMTYKWLAWA